MLTIWAAALAKEIGITTVAAVILFDVFLVPFDVAQPPGRYIFVVTAWTLQGIHVLGPLYRG
jgi:hypothetical protein